MICRFHESLHCIFLPSLHRRDLANPVAIAPKCFFHLATVITGKAFVLKEGFELASMRRW